jgi:mono/diheme cytochrome c family protein
VLRIRFFSIVIGAVAAAAAPVAVASAQSPSTTYLDQGWSKEIRELYYFTPQGSRTVPYAWFMALETTDGQGMFAATAHLERFGLIPADGPHPLNPGGLPIGFALDPNPTTRTGPDLGLTCAACHTANVTVDGRRIRIDGGAANFDFDRFYADLAAAVTRTLFDPAVFQRFAERVLTSPAPTAVAELQQQFAAFQAKIAGEAVIRRPTLASGFGRVDAMTQIVNALAVLDQGDPHNLRAVNAPTSYPSLWLAPQLEFVQWTPIAANPIARNGGEALGVFGTATLTGDPQGWFASSLLLSQLYAVESWLADLKPPKWNEVLFGPIDRTLAATGAGLYRQHCLGCHNAPPYRLTNPKDNLFGRTFIEIGRVDYREIGTDPTYMNAFLQRLVRTGPATVKANGGSPLVPAGLYLLNTAGAILGRSIDEANLTNDEKMALIGYRLRPPAEIGGQPRQYEPPSPYDLKASPLAGIWTSGPYLHNGSVATVYELLSPVAERRAVFWTGGRELDRKRLGFVSEDAPGRFRFDTSLPGNQRTGHLYPPQGLSPDERNAIIEYLKTL